MLVILRVLIFNAALSFRHASRATFLPEEGYKESASIGAHPAFLLREDQGPPLPVCALILLVASIVTHRQIKI
jgi:hypothetical protein